MTTTAKTTQEELDGIKALYDNNEIYGALLQLGFKTSWFENVHTFKVYRDNTKVSFVGGELKIKED